MLSNVLYLLLITLYMKCRLVQLRLIKPRLYIRTHLPVLLLAVLLNQVQPFTFQAMKALSLLSLGSH